MKIVKENVYVYDVQVVTRLIDAYEEYSCLGEGSFVNFRGIKMEQSAEIQFCVKLKKTGIKLFEMLKCMYGVECLSRTGVFEWHKGFKEGPSNL
jgi:hypothetical protein